MRWDDVNARARGLATHLLGRADLLRLASASTWEDLIRRLADSRYPVAGEGPVGAGAPELDRFAGRVAAWRLTLLGRWLGPRRRGVLAVVYEDEERRTIRTLLRGSAQGASPAIRLRSVTPTPDLPQRILERLARAESPAELARRLIAAGHPAGRVLEDELADARQLGLMGLEAALGRLFAARAARMASRGGSVVRAFTRQLLDLENAWTLLLAPHWGGDPRPADLFLPGGAALDWQTFEALASEPEAGRLRSGLADRFARTPLAQVFAGDTTDPTRLEARALGAQIAWHRALGRRDPLSPAVTIGVLQRIRAEARDLRAVVWGLALGAPGSAVAPQLVTA